MTGVTAPRVFLSALSLAFVAPTSLWAQSNKEIRWRQNLAKAMEESADEGRPVLADFGAVW